MAEQSRCCLLAPLRPRCVDAHGPQHALRDTIHLRAPRAAVFLLLEALRSAESENFPQDLEGETDDDQRHVDAGAPHAWGCLPARLQSGRSTQAYQPSDPKGTRASLLHLAAAVPKTAGLCAVS